MQLVYDRCCPVVIVLRRCQRISDVMTALYIIPSLLWLVLIHVELRNCHVLGTTIVGLLRSEIFGKTKDFRQFDKYFFGIIYYINQLCTCLVKSF